MSINAGEKHSRGRVSCAWAWTQSILVSDDCFQPALMSWSSWYPEVLSSVLVYSKCINSHSTDCYLKGSKRKANAWTCEASSQEPGWQAAAMHQWLETVTRSCSQLAVAQLPVWHESWLGASNLRTKYPQYSKQRCQGLGGLARVGLFTGFSDIAFQCWGSSVIQAF